jgi:Domain of unknown function DUF29
MLFKNMNQPRVTLDGIFPSQTAEQYYYYPNDKDKFKHQLQQLITLLLLWRQLPKYRNLQTEAKIGLLRQEIKFYYPESEQLIEFSQARYSDIYRLAVYAAAIQAVIRYKAVLNQAMFRLDETLHDNFFPVSDNVYNIIKISVMDNLRSLISYCIYRSKRIK